MIGDATKSFDASGVGDLSGNLKALSSFPTASGFGLLGRPSSTSRGRLASLLRRRDPDAISSDPLREGEGRSRVPLLEVPVMLMRAIVSGEGERRRPSGASVMGDEGADDVNGKEERFSGSGRLNGAGAGSASAICGMGGSKC